MRCEVFKGQKALTGFSVVREVEFPPTQGGKENCKY